MYARMVALAVSAALFAFSVPALAQQPDERCKPMSDFTTILPQMGALGHTVLRGDAAARAVMVYNSLPPESDTPFTAAVVADMPDGVGLLGVGFGDTVCSIVPIPPQVWGRMKRHILGERI